MPCNYSAFATFVWTAVAFESLSLSPTFTLFSGISSSVPGLSPTTDIRYAGLKSSPDRIVLAAAIFARFRLDDVAPSNPDVRDPVIKTWRLPSADGPPSEVWRAVAVGPGPPPTIVRTNRTLGNVSITVTATVANIFEAFPTPTGRLLCRCSRPSNLQSN